jgi:hypothetical protein
MTQANTIPGFGDGEIYFQVTTDASGNITAWNVQAQNGAGTVLSNYGVGLTEDASNSNSAPCPGCPHGSTFTEGSWVDPVLAPEPSSLLLFTTTFGALIAAIFLRKRIVQSRTAESRRLPSQ